MEAWLAGDQESTSSIGHRTYSTLLKRRSCRRWGGTVVSTTDTYIGLDAKTLT